MTGFPRSEICDGLGRKAYYITNSSKKSKLNIINIVYMIYIFLILWTTPRI